MVKECRSDKRIVLPFVIILLVATFFRILQFGLIPGGINQDEAFAAMDGWALAMYGTDHYGMSFPVHLTAWKYGQMSALLSYLMVPFIKIFGFNIWSVRLPSLILSTVSVAVIYGLGKEIKDKKLGLMLMALTAINPWHFMQSRWSLDCNLFPHVFLIGLFFLMLGHKKRIYLYISMIFFGLTLYCYGIAVYTVIPFLLVYSLLCVVWKKLKVKEVLIGALLFLVISIPEILVMAINFFGWNTITVGRITFPSFYESVRSNDILFLNFSFAQLWRNVLSLIKTVFVQLPDFYFNSIPLFGPMYHISIPFMIIGIVKITMETFAERDATKLAIFGQLMMGIWAGIVTFEVNVNRVNIIYFTLIICVAEGILWCRDVVRRKGVNTKRFCIGIVLCYAIDFIVFLAVYFTILPARVKDYYNVDYLKAMDYVSTMDSEVLYVSSNLGWQDNWQMAEILAQYELRIDPLYYQEKTNMVNGVEQLSYSEKYHFNSIGYINTLDLDSGTVVVLNEKDDFVMDSELLMREGEFEIRIVK